MLRLRPGKLATAPGPTDPDRAGHREADAGDSCVARTETLLILRLIAPTGEQGKQQEAHPRCTEQPLHGTGREKVDAFTSNVEVERARRLRRIDDEIGAVRTGQLGERR